MRYQLIAMALLILAGCARSDPSEIYVGVAVPLTGPTAFYGEDIKEGVEMAVREINAEGGVGGRPIEIIYEDTECPDNIKALAALKKLHEIDGVVAIIGPFCGSENMIAGQYSTDSEAFIISPGDNFGHIGDNMVNTRYLIDAEGELIGNYLIDNNLTRIGILVYNNDWGARYREVVRRVVEERGGAIIAEEAYDYSNLDVRTQLAKIQVASPDALFITDATGTVSKQIHELDIDVPLVTEWEISRPEIIQAAGSDSLEGVVFFLPRREKTSFAERFRSSYGADPTLQHADGYDAAKLLFSALEACEGDEPDCLTAHIISVKDYDGANGRMTFNKTTWAFEKEFTKATIKNGQVVLLE